MWLHSITAYTPGTQKVPDLVWSHFHHNLLNWYNQNQLQCGHIPPNHTQLASYGLVYSTRKPDKSEPRIPDISELRKPENQIISGNSELRKQSGNSELRKQSGNLELRN